MNNNYLSHHGILRQKWGVRRYQNPDGTLTAAGKKRYLSDRQVKKVHETFDETSYSQDVSKSIFKITGADKRALAKAKDEVINCINEQKRLTKETNDLFKDIRDDDSPSSKYRYFEVASELASSLSYFNKDDCTLDDLGYNAYQAIFDDGQQSIINAYSMFTYKNGLQNKVANLTQKWNQTSDDYKKAAENYIQDALNQVGGENLTVSKTSNTKAARMMVQRMVNDKQRKLPVEQTYGIYNLNSASGVVAFKDRDKAAIAKAEKIVKNVSDNTNIDTWRFFNEAVENLGMSGIKTSELTRSDWNRINKEISELKDSGDDWEDDDY